MRSSRLIHVVLGTLVAAIAMLPASPAGAGIPAGRYAIGDRDKLKFNDDGSLTLYLQNESPGKEKESNWLPAPKDCFSLFMRLYWPKKEILDGSWLPPAVVNQAAEVRQVA